MNSMGHGWGRVSWEWKDREPWLELPFPEDEYGSRIERVRRVAERLNVDAIVVVGDASDKGTIRYLSNFEVLFGGHAVLAIPTSNDDPVLISNSVMHGEPMHSGFWMTWVRDARAAMSPRTGGKAGGLWDELVSALSARRALRRIGVAGHSSRILLERELSKRVDDAELVDVTAELDDLQAYKSPVEVEMLRKSAHATDRGLAAALAACRPGVAECDIAGEAVRAMYAAGAEDLVFLSVVGGALSGFKHALPRQRKLEPGDMVFLDMGCSVGGYLSDASRCAVAGPASDEQLAFLRAAEDIEDAIYQKMAPGKTIGELAAEAQEMAEDRGVAEYLYFRGHGIGTSTHVPPAFFPGSPTPFEEGMVFAFEPMLVRKGFGTAVVENVIHMTASGADSLNEAPKRWRPIDVA